MLELGVLGLNEQGGLLRTDQILRLVDRVFLSVVVGADREDLIPVGFLGRLVYELLLREASSGTAAVLKISVLIAEVHALLVSPEAAHRLACTS